MSSNLCQAPRSEVHMHAGYGHTAADNYLLQRINGASQEQLAALLLEGAQRFVLQCIAAIGNRDIPRKTRAVNKASAIIEELAVWVSPEAEDELSRNLTRIYDWWLHELFEGSQLGQPDRLERIQRQMGDMRGTWEELHLKRTQTSKGTSRLGEQGMVG